MSIQPVWQEDLTFFGTPIILEPSQAQLSSDAGLLPIRQFDEHIGFTQAFAAALHDPRDPDLIEHSYAQMLRTRVYGILADYEDQNDHDALRSDPVFKRIANRSPEDEDLASQPTLSRFENAIDIPSLKRLREVLVDRFIASYAQPPRYLTLDLDAVDEPAHGCQQLTFWHNYYDQNQYLPLVISCAENDQIPLISLRPGHVHAALGSDDDLEYLVGRLRRAWPEVHLSVRADAAFGIPAMYDVCERLNVTYTFGLIANAVLKRQSEALLKQAEAAFAAERQSAYEQGRCPQSQRLFDGFWYCAGTWSAPRWVIVKAEANAEGSQRRFIVTNRPGGRVLPGATYEDYGMRGESENRNKEFKCDLAMDRLSDHRFKANFFRLYLHVIAMNLQIQMRTYVAVPMTEMDPEPMPAPAAAPPLKRPTLSQRQRAFRQRRQRDPLGRGQPATWRQMFIKVAAEIQVSCRRVVIRLASNWPHLGLFQRICAVLVKGVKPAPMPSG